MTAMGGLESILEPSKTLIVNMNYSMDTFSRIFSKMEVVMALDYLFEKASVKGIPMIYTSGAPPMQCTTVRSRNTWMQRGRGHCEAQPPLSRYLTGHLRIGSVTSFLTARALS
ncbi:hypothetical protein [Thermogymnomonas acidicola]|uniref:hypothetical protein n=1 Tax=Thermogymnomonas acidicola TaxID=399579 RepID=UPI0013967FFB|nr:hypothetical protein [Thermogymnomonas acidicola]